MQLVSCFKTMLASSKVEGEITKEPSAYQQWQQRPGSFVDYIVNPSKHTQYLTLYLLLTNLIIGICG